MMLLHFEFLAVRLSPGRAHAQRHCQVHVSDVSYSVSMSSKNLYFDFFIDMKPRFRFQSEDAVLKFMQFGVDKAL